MDLYNCEEPLYKYICCVHFQTEHIEDVVYYLDERRRSMALSSPATTCRACNFMLYFMHIAYDWRSAAEAIRDYVIKIAHV